MHTLSEKVEKVAHSLKIQKFLIIFELETGGEVLKFQLFSLDISNLPFRSHYRLAKLGLRLLASSLGFVFESINGRLR
jgi:hypothetical protein